MNASMSPSHRRGACPGLSAPMQTGDGLLVRLASAGATISALDLLRAEFAMPTRRLDTTVEQRDNGNASRLAELGRKGDNPVRNAVPHRPTTTGAHRVRAPAC